MKQAHKYFLLISAGILLMLGLLWYNHSVNNQEPPLLKADHLPKRIKPENSDDKIVGNNENIYDTLKGQSESIKNVNIIPEPETPINISSLQKTEPQEDAIDSIISGIVGAAEKQTTEPQNIEENSEGKSLNIVTIAEDRVIKSDAAGSSNKRLKTEYYIQIASTRTKEQANKEWLRVSKTQAKLFSGINHKIVKYELSNSGIFYQLLIGPLKNSSHTKLICKKLVNTKLNCVIKRM